jgi:hypothetical protein
VIKRPLRPHLSFDDRSELLETMGRVRAIANGFGASNGFNSPQHKLTDSLQVAIDALATELTGDPTYFHAKPHGGGYH